jgi:hypothetical protein
MSFELDDLDKTSRPKTHKEELEHYKFLKSIINEVAVRVGNSPLAPLNVTSGIGIPAHDKIDVTYPNLVTEVFTYSLEGTPVLDITVTYVSGAKHDILSVVKG